MSVSVKTAERVRSAIEVLIAKIDRADPIALAADASPVWRRQLERNFKDLGTTLAKELRRIRVELAVGELAHPRAGSIQIRGIAMRLGYSSERRLREATVASYGLTPGEIRRGSRFERRTRQAEAARRQGQKRPARGIWGSDRRRRRDRQAFQLLLKKANPAGVEILTGQIQLPRAGEARGEASALAQARVKELFDHVRPPLRSVA